MCTYNKECPRQFVAIVLQLEAEIAEDRGDDQGGEERQCSEGMEGEGKVMGIVVSRHCRRQWRWLGWTGQ
jgi:hypothetical protein